jgi:hypothetical protein
MKGEADPAYQERRRVLQSGFSGSSTASIINPAPAVRGQVIEMEWAESKQCGCRSSSMAAGVPRLVPAADQGIVSVHSLDRHDGRQVSLGRLLDIEIHRHVSAPKLVCKHRSS